MTRRRKRILTRRRKTVTRRRKRIVTRRRKTVTRKRGTMSDEWIYRH